MAYGPLSPTVRYPSAYSAANDRHSNGRLVALNRDFRDEFDPISGRLDIEQGSEVHNSPGEDSGYLPSLLRTWRPYFDVTTKDVVHRIRMAIPFGRSDERFWDSLHECPDLYGPLWISISLIFVLAVSGNIASSLAYKMSTNAPRRSLFHEDRSNFEISSPSPALSLPFDRDIVAVSESLNRSYFLNDDLGRQSFPVGGTEGQWKPSFDPIVRGVVIVPAIVIGGSCILWTRLIHLGNKRTMSEVVSLVGYSLTSFVLCGAGAWIPRRVVQWGMMFLGAIGAIRFVLFNCNEEAFGTIDRSVEDVAKSIRHSMIGVCLFYVGVAVLVRATLLPV